MSIQQVDEGFQLEEYDKVIGHLENYTSLLDSSASSSRSAAVEIEEYQKLSRDLTLLSQRMARSPSERVAFVNNALLQRTITALASLYSTFERAQALRPSLSQDEDETTPSTVTKEEDDLYLRISNLAMLCMRILRNVMADNSEAQMQVCQRFDRLLPFLVNITRFHNLNDPDTALLCRAAVQMLSNLITRNSNVQDEMWPRIVTAEQDEDKLVLKFLSSPDTATSSAAQVLLINFLRAPDSISNTHQRCYELCSSTPGLRIIESLLSSSQSIVLRTASESQDDAESESDKKDLEDSLGFIWTVFAVLFEQGYSSMLVSALAPIEETSSTSTATDAPMVSSSQLILLKLLDTWLHSNQKQLTDAQDTFGSTMYLTGTIRNETLRGGGISGLVDVFKRLSAFARGAMASGIAKEGTPEDIQPQDRRLIGVHSALLLLLECFMSINMSADGWSHDAVVEEGDKSFADLSCTLLTEMRRDRAFVEELVSLLDKTHQYAPALSPFRPSKDANGSAGDRENRPLPQGHALSSTGKAGKEIQPTYGFDHLKRDIVRVLGSLVYAPTGNYGPESGAKASSSSDSTLTKTQIREVQDLVREKGGLFHVLNMTVLDERNPCKCRSLAPFHSVATQTDASSWCLNRHARARYLYTPIFAGRQSRITKPHRFLTADPATRFNRGNAVTYGVISLLTYYDCIFVFLRSLRRSRIAFRTTLVSNLLSFLPLLKGVLIVNETGNIA